MYVPHTSGCMWDIHWMYVGHTSGCGRDIGKTPLVDVVGTSACMYVGHTCQKNDSGSHDDDATGTKLCLQTIPIQVSDQI